MRKLALAVAASAALVSAGCSALGRAAFKQPVVTLKQVQLRGVGLTGGTLGRDAQPSTTRTIIGSMRRGSPTRC